MGVVVRFLDPAALHLKSEAQKLGRNLVKHGGGARNVILDGFILKGIATEKTAIVTVLSMPYGFTSPLQNIYAEGIVREVRVLLAEGRKTLDNLPATPVVVTPDQYRPYQQGVAVVAGIAFASVRNGAWSTTDPVLQPGVITQAATRVGSTGTAWFVDTVIYRATSARKTLLTSAGDYDIDFRLNEPTTLGELAYIIIGAAAMGFNPGTTTSPVIGAVTRACEMSAETGFVVTLAPSTAYFVRYDIDLPTSIVTITWRYNMPAVSLLGLFYSNGTLISLQRDDDNHVLVSLDPDTGSAVAHTMFPIDEALVSNPTAYTLNDDPWFFCPRKKTSALPGSLAYWTALEDLDVVLVSPVGGVLTVSTPGYFVQRGTNRLDRAGSSDDGTVGVGGDIDGHVAYYGTNTFPEFGVSNVCVYAPGILAAVVVPNADFALANQRRYIALIDAMTGSMLRVSAAPVFTGDIWYGVSVSCYEQGEVASGDLSVNAALLVSVWRPYVAALDAGAPNPTTVGVWATVDAGDTLSPVYQPDVYNALAPFARAVYMGSPLIPPKLGVTRNQWISGRESRVI